MGRMDEKVFVSLDSRTFGRDGRRLHGVAATTGVQLEKSADIPGYGRVSQMFFHDGCFDRSLERDDLAVDLIIGHDDDQRPWASTTDDNLSVRLDGKRLRWEAELPDVPNAERLALSLSDGKYQGVSAGGTVPAPYEVNRNGVLQVREYDIHFGHIAIVPVPANADTSVEVALMADRLLALPDEDLRVILDKVVRSSLGDDREGPAPDGGKDDERNMIVDLWRQRLAREL